MRKLIAILILLAAAATVHAAGTKTLVAYFSATGNTKAVAERIAALTGADLYSITPSRPYAANPYDDSQRIQDEAYNDRRPAVANLPSQEQIAQYDTIFVGSPLWWHQPAMVVCTFLESYDLSGKVIVPFMTYGATTYLNEGMQKLYKCTPGSVHIPATLPEDIDPDNIREPQDDDEGIDVPARPGEVEGWLRRMGLLHDAAGVADITSAEYGMMQLSPGLGTLSVSVADGHSPAWLQIASGDGIPAYAGYISGSADISLTGGVYVVQMLSARTCGRDIRKILVRQ
ncbi:MAG: hypothetical protein NC333_05470 [Terasakiella sp.]|nr:hypothetical protein [Terasakiella sp.]